MMENPMNTRPPSPGGIQTLASQLAVAYRDVGYLAEERQSLEMQLYQTHSELARITEALTPAQRKKLGLEAEES